MKRQNTFVPIGIATAALAALVAGTMLYTRTRPEAVPSVPQRAPARDDSAAQAILPQPLPSRQLPIDMRPQDGGYIFEVATDDNGSHLKRVNHTFGSGGLSNSSPMMMLSDMASEPNSPLPSGTQVNSYNVKDGLATVDFNQSFVDNFKGGDEAEALTINAVLATIGQFGPHSVQITVEGKKIDSLGGTQSLAHPLPVPQVSEQTAQSGANP